MLFPAFLSSRFLLSRREVTGEVAEDMKVVILAGGRGTRLSEETAVRPKPMVEIGGHPMLWHIMKGYAHFGVREFVLAIGYKGEVIKDFFVRYQVSSSDLVVDLKSGRITYEHPSPIDWQVSLIDTGEETETGGRLHRLADRLRPGGTFMMTYGDGLADINISTLLDFHRRHGRLATLTAVRPPARFGTMRFDGDQVAEFMEKPQTGEGWINGGFYVFEPGVLDYIPDNQTILERSPLERLAHDGQLMAYRHEGFWQCMDTIRDKVRLEALWQGGSPPWRIWA
jgi:glucose-1-phosphate cytidylyltransferase